MPLRLLACCVVLIGGLAATVDASMRPAPHRAFYDLNLIAARGSQPVTSVQGGMDFEWRQLCDGWTVRHRARMQLAYAERGGVSIGWSFNAWESDDGTRYRFFIQRFREGERTEEVRGRAELESVGGPGVARYTMPEEREVELPAGTLFPMQHTEAVIEAARAGDMPLWRMVFDGSGEDSGLYGVNAVLAESLGPDAAPGFESALIRNVPSWRVSLAFFPAEGDSATPVHEQSLRLFENGVGSELILDYGEFTLRAKLKELEALEAPDC